MTETSDTQQPITLLICALGGEGGGVLAEWLVTTATKCGFAAQSTSIPGVAQRTGSTTYYIEVHPVPIAELGGRRPVFSLYPVAGALDALVSSELLETVRQIGHGMVSPERTRVVTSTSRTLTTAEKMQLADGRASTENLLAVIAKYSREYSAFDMSALARDAGTIVSAVLLGAIAGCELLPLPRHAYEKTIHGSGRGVDASMRGFARAYESAQACSATYGAGADIAAAIPSGIRKNGIDESAVNRTGSGQTGVKSADTTNVSNDREVQDVLPEQARNAFPQSALDMISRGYMRMIDYQDVNYAHLYLTRLSQVFEAERACDSEEKHDFAVTREAARYLALWMAFDDIVRVADLKCRASRFTRVRSEVKAEAGEIVRIIDFFKPGVAEFAALLPAGIASRLLRWDKSRRNAGKSPLALPIKVSTHTVVGLLTLRALASARWLRRRGSRFFAEQAMIERWLDGIRQGLRCDWQVGHEIAQCGRLIKGYGTTNERGKENLLHVLDHLAGATFDSEQARAQAIGAARSSALADDTGKALDQMLVSHGAPARPIKAQPVVWMKKPRQPVS